jgi:epoxyqueuosine reductase
MDSTVTLTSESVKTLALEVGFDLCGIAGVTASRSAVARFNSWVDRGLCAAMSYLARNPERRADLRLSMPEASSVIVLGVGYYCPNNDAIPPGHGRVARYARGRDYHEVLTHKCQCLMDRIQSELTRLGLPTAKSKCWVDSGPVMEKAFAVMAGLGNIGRNGLLINRRFGSWVLLAEVVTDIPLAPDQIWPGEHGSCGNCRRCIDACPTGAITPDGLVDANRCLSYWTIEHRGVIPPSIASRVGQSIFGCDICQEVCPRNKHVALTNHGELMDKSGVGEFLNVYAVNQLTDEAGFLKLTCGTALARLKLDRLKRNAAIVQANSEANRAGTQDLPRE